ncbi:DedA family protein [Buchnera aphidicola]|uniref:DedA family protein n=1 Tax=Buchnera aphidicola TaxID=9 RepID=UPI002093121E|nr:DedA family protein [Buchnera aphidicola]USS94228.1 DedA family protein [Buchnera aphidicola (Sipha maydis)]WII23776.1 DedA family protein [Buchnera aphidicola (Sipha maydis)]
MIIYLLNYISHQSLISFCIIVMIISFCESLAFIGLFLPGIIIMSAIGAIIANAHNKFYPAWICSSIGCLLGDWISYFIGRKFKKWIYTFQIFKRNSYIIEKIQQTLYKYSISTIFFGKLIGFTRPIIPIISGMLKIPFFKKFFWPNLFSCIIWPLLYLMPGIITTLLLKLPNYHDNSYFKTFLISNILIITINTWIIWTSIKEKNNKIINFLIKKNIFWIPKLMLIIGIINIFLLQFNSKMILLRKLIIEIFFF